MLSLLSPQDRGNVDLQAHPVVDELSRIAPEFLVTGGSFSRWLPHPRDVPRAERPRLRLAAQRQATGRCLIDLLATAGLPPVEPEHLASGAREWPPGYTGSVSHKGTTVAAALTCTDATKSIGIDIEMRAQKGVPELPGLDSVEHPPSVSATAGRDVLFAVKESGVQGAPSDSRASTRLHGRHRVLAAVRCAAHAGHRPRVRRRTGGSLLDRRALVDRVRGPVANLKPSALSGGRARTTTTTRSPPELMPV